MNFADVISIDWSIDESDVWLIDRSFDWLIDWSKFVVLMMIDVIEVFDSNFRTVDSENSDSDSKDSKNSKNPKDSQSSINSKKFEEFIADLSNESTFMTTSTFFFSISINTVITIRIDPNDRFFNTRKNRPFSDLIEKIMKYDNMK